MERTVKVWDQDVKISVYQKSKTVWMAVGKYLGHRIEVNGRSANSAVVLWVNAARYKGNEC